MALALELETSFSQPYIKNYIIASIREFGIKAVVHQEKRRIICAFESSHPKLSECLEFLGNNLPASCFLSGSRHYDIDGEPEAVPDFEVEYPVSIGLCPQCQKEVFDPSSRRYYYPFTQCTHCGGQYGFFHKYPYVRANTSLSYIKACPECEKEADAKGRREKQVLNTCHSCGIPVRMIHKGKERYANDAGSFRTLFEVAAKAIRDGHTLLMKTTMGFRRFSLEGSLRGEQALMLVDASRITSLCALIHEEFNALLSIERPVLHVALKDETLRERFGNSADVKYPDEGFTILLAKELVQLGIDAVIYEPSHADAEAEFVMEFDLEVESQSDMRLMINKDIRFIVSGERVSFPSRIPLSAPSLGIAHGYAAISDSRGTLFDRMEHFDTAKAYKVCQLENELPAVDASNFHTFAADEAAMMSVIADHGFFGEKAVGGYFEGEPSFLYYDGKKVIRVVPPHRFSPVGLMDAIGSLREGSDRLLKRFQSEFPEIAAELAALEEGKSSLFDAAAIILGLEEKNFSGVMKEALKFLGKGGVQVDTHVEDNRFNHTAFLASLISYKMAGVDSIYLSYSIFESFGDYFSELINEIKGKTKATRIILCGSYFGAPSLFSRIERNLKTTPPLMNANYPIGKENCVVGGAFL